MNKFKLFVSVVVFSAVGLGFDLNTFWDRWTLIEFYITPAINKTVDFFALFGMVISGTMAPEEFFFQYVPVFVVLVGMILSIVLIKIKKQKNTALEG